MLYLQLVSHGDDFSRKQLLYLKCYDCLNGILFRHWSLVATESREKRARSREGQLCAILRGGRTLVLQSEKKHRRNTVMTEMNSDERDPLSPVDEDIIYFQRKQMQIVAKKMTIPQKMKTTNGSLMS